MNKARRTMQNEFGYVAESQAARSLAPEDLRAGEFVAILDRVLSLPSYLWDSESMSATELVRIPWPAGGAGVPLKVKSVCLPFVAVKTPGGRCRVLDVRHCRLVRLSSDFAARVWKALKQRKSK